MENKPSNWEQVKAAVIAIFIGTCISMLTVLFQYAVEWLRDIPAELPGAAAGMIKYVVKWRSFPHA